MIILAEAAAAIATLGALEKGIEVGALGFKEAQKIFRETIRTTWLKAFGEYDIEKVFFRGVYSVGLLFVAKIAYEMIITGHLIKEHSEWIVEKVIERMPPAWTYIFGITGVVGWYILGPKPTKEEQEARKEEIKQKREQIIEELGIPAFIDNLMTKNFGLVILAVCGYWAYTEYRRMRRMRALL